MKLRTLFKRIFSSIRIATIKYAFLGLFFLLYTGTTNAKVRLPAIFSDHMVLQHSAAVNIWGWADLGEKISVRGGWSQEVVTTVTDESGKWNVRLTTPQSGETFELLVTGENEIRIKDVLLGEVWVCSGQSNMAWNMARTENYQNELERTNSQIRYFQCERRTSASPVDVVGKWIVVNTETLGALSGVGYHFGNRLNQALKCPIGLIVNAYGGSTIESWISRDILEKQGYFLPVLNGLDAMMSDMENRMIQHQKMVVADWEKQVEQAKKEGRKPPKKPNNPRPFPQHRPAHCYNAMLNGIIPYTMKGILWYQGESNAGRGNQYKKLLTPLIESWRTQWGQGNFPFYIALLAPHISHNPTDVHKAEIRLAEIEVAQETDNCEIVSTMDVGNLHDIHPRRKKEVGERFALLALADTYKVKGIAAHGPTFKKMKISGSKVLISFERVKELRHKPDTLKGFQVAGLDGKYYMANAEIVKNKILVSSTKVLKPEQVRFALYDGAEVFIYNESGMPMLPFKTDDFVWESEGNIYPGYLSHYLNSTE